MSEPTMYESSNIKKVIKKYNDFPMIVVHLNFISNDFAWFFCYPDPINSMNSGNIQILKSKISSKSYQH